MRTYLARLAFIGLAGVAIVSCGTQNGSSPGNAIPNGAGGGGVPISNSNAPPPPQTIPGLLIDGGNAVAFSAFNTTGTVTAVGGSDAGQDIGTAGSGPPPVNPTPPGFENFSFSGNGAMVVAFKKTASLPNLDYFGQLPGQIIPVDYGAIVFYEGATVSGATPAIEIQGGSGASAFDMRSTCTVKPDSRPQVPFPGARFVCILPPYNSAAGSTGTGWVVDSQPIGSSAPALLVPGDTGLFTPVAGSTLYFEQIFAANSVTTTTYSLTFDYMYAESGTN